MPTNGTPPAAPGLSPQQNQVLQAQLAALNSYSQMLQQQGAVGLGLLPSMLARSGFNYSAAQVPNLTIPKTGKVDTDTWLKSTYKTLTGMDPTAAQLANLSPLLKNVTTQDQASAAQSKVLQAIAGTPEGQKAGLTYANGNVYTVNDQYGPSIQKTTQGNLTLADMYQQRAGAALSGKLPLDPALLQQLQDQQTQFFQGLASKYGSAGGAALSTPAQQASYYQNMFQTNALEQARRADIANSQNLANSALTGAQASVSPAPALAGAFGGAQGFGNLAQGYGNPFGNLASQQMLGYQGQLNAYNANALGNASLFGAGGSLLGASLPYLFGSASSQTGGGLFGGLSGLLSGLGSGGGGSAGASIGDGIVNGLSSLFG